MSLRYEQYRALRKCRDLLYDMLSPQRRPSSVRELRLRTFDALRHFPTLDEHGRPHFSEDDFGPDDPRFLP
jgi:hypothetical protein